MTDTGKRGWGWFWAFVGVGPAVCEGTAQAGFAAADGSEWSPGVLTSASALQDIPSVTGCESTWDPWPMGLPGGVLILAGLVAYVLASRAATRPARG